MLWIASTRYYLGRQTAEAGTFCKHLAAAWSQLDKATRDVLSHSVESAFRRDDIMRESMPPSPTSTTGLPLGMDCDRREWEFVRRLWTS